MENISHKSNQVFIVIIAALSLTTIYYGVLNERSKISYHFRLLARCDTSLPEVNGQTAIDTIAALNRYHDSYFICAATHNALIDALAGGLK